MTSTEGMVDKMARPAERMIILFEIKCIYLSWFDLFNGITYLSLSGSKRLGSNISGSVKCSRL